MNRYVIYGVAALFAAGAVNAGTRPASDLDVRAPLVGVDNQQPLMLADRYRDRDRAQSRRVVGREVCEDVEVTERRERDGNAGGTIAGALIGGVLGNQVGSGSGRKAATVAGAVAGGYAGNRIDRNHDGGKRRTHVERECYTVYDDNPRYR